MAKQTRHSRRTKPAVTIDGKAEDKTADKAASGTVTTSGSGSTPGSSSTSGSGSTTSGASSASNKDSTSGTAGASGTGGTGGTSGSGGTAAKTDTAKTGATGTTTSAASSTSGTSKTGPSASSKSEPTKSESAKSEPPKGATAASGAASATGKTGGTASNPSGATPSSTKPGDPKTTGTSSTGASSADARSKPGSATSTGTATAARSTSPATKADNDNRGGSPILAGLIGAAAALVGVWLLSLFGVFGGDDDVDALRAEIAQLRETQVAADGLDGRIDERVTAAVDQAISEAAAEAGAGNGPIDTALVTALDERIARLESIEGERVDAGGLTPEIQARLDSIEAAVGGGEGGGNALAALEQRLAAIEGGSVGGETVAAAEARIAQVEQALGAGDSEARQALASLQARLDEIAAGNADTLTRQEARLEALGGEVATVGTGVTGAVAAIATVRDQLDALRGQVADLDQSLATANGVIEEGSARSETLAGDIAIIRERVEGVRTSIAQIERDAGQTGDTLQTAVTRLDDVAGRVDDLSGRTDQIAARIDDNDEQLSELAAVVEESRSDTTIARTLAASNLKTAIDRGSSFAQELESYVSVASDPNELEPLREFAGRGVPTVPELLDRFPAAADAILRTELDIDEDAGPLDQLLGSARGLVAVRPTGGEDGNDTRAIVARMEAALRQADLDRVLAEAGQLSPEAQEAASPYLADVRARAAANSLIDGALARAIRPQG